ncbi:MAG TPA: diguanylate cyclase [Noviherbaspirillum sp.]
MTCSIGITVWLPEDTIEAVIKRADIALYEAKSSGRDKVIANL